MDDTRSADAGGSGLEVAFRGRPADPLSRRLMNVGLRLRDAFQAVVDELPVRSGRAQELALQLNIHRTLASRVLTALRVDDPLAAAARFPRSEGLRIFLNAARGSARPQAIDEAIAALNEFEELVHGELGGWDGLEAAISEWLPEAREKMELSAKQQAFKGMSTVLGARADVQLITCIYHPSKDREHCDIAAIDGLVGLRRLRPHANIPFAAVGMNPHEPQPLAAIEEVRATGERPSPLLEAFCSKPLPKYDVFDVSGIHSYVLTGNEIGLSSSTDMVTASVVHAARPLYQPRSGKRVRVAHSSGLNVPAVTLLINVLLHDDVWPGADPELVVYDTHMHGATSPNDPASAILRIDMLESIQYLGRGAPRFRAAEVGNHVDMVHYVCDKLGWDSERLRGYRCRVKYPLFNAQYCMVFDPPEMPR